MTEIPVAPAVDPPKWNGKTAAWREWALQYDAELPEDVTRGDLQARFGDVWRALHAAAEQVPLVPADHLAERVTFEYDGDEYVVTREPGLPVDPDDVPVLLEAAAAAGVLIKVKE